MEMSLKDRIAEIDESLVLANKLKVMELMLSDLDRLGLEEWQKFYQANPEELRSFVRRVFNNI